MNKKIKVMNQRPEVSDEEIKSFMDFDAVLHQREQQIRIVKRASLIRKIVVSLVVVAVIAVVFWTVKNEQPHSGQTVREESGTHNEPNQVQEKNTEPEVIEKQFQPSESSEKRSAPVISKEEPARETAAAEPVTGEAKVVEDNYVQAEPVDGYQQLYDYFSKNLIYPQEAVKDSLQGVSTVTFIINKEGVPGKIDVTNSLGPAFDREIARLIGNMPGWKPASLNGKPVPSRISLPITFHIQKTGAK